jgi:hypothetical protein
MSEERFDIPSPLAGPPEFAAATHSAAVPASRPAPRPGIAHVLVYTACVAVELAVWQADGPFGFDPSFDTFESLPQAIAWTALALVGMSLTAFGMATVPVMIARWWKRMTFPFAPGEWLLAAIGIAGWLQLLVTFAMQIVSPEELGELDLRSTLFELMLSRGLLMLAFTTTMAIGAWRLRREKRWAVCLAGWGMATGVQAFVSLVGAWQMWFDGPVGSFEGDSVAAVFIALGGAITAVVAFCVAVILDLRWRTPRGWLHWLGIATIVAMVLLSIVQIIVLVVLGR